MTILAILFGLFVPAANGWLLLGLIQNTVPVLFRGERIAAGFAIGTALTMFLVFCANIVFGLSLSFWPFFLLQAFLFAVLLATCFLRKIPLFAVRAAASADAESKAVKMLMFILAAWTAAKVATLGITFLFLTPTYFDDAVDNWNLRAKAFFETTSIQLALPGSGGAPADVSSYPPTVPLMKTWMADVAGWNDAAVNAVHLAWFLSALALLYYALRRYVSRAWSVFGTYAIVSMPLYLMHGTNAYADVFMGVHVFAAIIFLFHAMHADTDNGRDAFLRMGAVAAAILPFTKNEGLLIYLPPILLILAAYLFLDRARIGTKAIVKAAAWYAACILAVLLPWIAYKYAHGLTFGNAKGVGTLAFGWQEKVLSAVTVNTLFEGNWLLLFPVLASLLAWRRRAAFGALAPVTALFLIVYAGQMLIYLFTSVSVEAVMQTGYARGVLQLLPVMAFLTTMLLKDGYEALRMK